MPVNLEVSTFRDWGLRKLFPDCPPDLYPVANDKKRENLVATAISELEREERQIALSNGRRGSRFLLDEIDNVIKARGIKTSESYLMVERVGRGKGLRRGVERPIFWKVYQRYQEQMDERGWIAYSDIPGLVLERLGKEISRPEYDNVIVDEAQDLSPLELRVTRALVKDRSTGKGLTLLADPAQSIYYMGIPWKEAEIEITGTRTKILKKNFRNTKQILAAAKPVIEQCQVLRGLGEYIEPTASDRVGPKPILVRFETKQKQYDCVVNEILRLSQMQKYRPGDCAVLARTNDQLPNLKAQLARADIPVRHFREDGFAILENEVKLITMHSAKGLEFPVVFILDVEDGFIPYKGGKVRREDEDDDNELDGLERERKLFYVSMTRASERLYMLYPRAQRSPFLFDIPEDLVQERRID